MTSIYTTVYHQLVRAQSGRGLAAKIQRTLLRQLRQLLLRRNDPTIESNVRGYQLQHPFAHQLPIYAAVHPQFDTLFTRLCDYLRERDGAVVGIDVGTNIGYGIVSSFQSGDTFFAVEGNPVYLPFLERNLARFEQVTIVPKLAGDKVGEQQGLTLETVRGTARLTKGSAETQLAPFTTLDTLQDEYPTLQNTNYLKIDTDGFDLTVLRGARRLIAQNRPIVLFEADPMGDPNYAADLCETLSWFDEINYQHGLIYDNTGNLFGQFSPSDLTPVRYATLYQMSQSDLYFDIVLLPSDMALIASEQAHAVLMTGHSKLAQAIFN